jgi:hypothetical protein
VEASTADAFVAALHEARCPAELPTIEKRLGPGDDAIGSLCGTPPPELPNRGAMPQQFWLAGRE